MSTQSLKENHVFRWNYYFICIRHVTTRGDGMCPNFMVAHSLLLQSIDNMTCL